MSFLSKEIKRKLENFHFKIVTVKRKKKNNDEKRN